MLKNMKRRIVTDGANITKSMKFQVIVIENNARSRVFFDNDSKGK